MFENGDPYDTLMDLVKFANHADKHLNNLIKNQKVLLDTLNKTQEQIELQSKRIDLLEKRIYGIDES
jgi:hypothetical protein